MMQYLRKSILVVGFLATLSTGSKSILDPPARINHYGKSLLNKRLTDMKFENVFMELDPNVLIDKVLHLVDQTILARHLDPYEFAEGEFLGVHYDAWIGGYSSLARLGDASIIHSDNTVDITVMLQMTNLAGNFSFWLKVLGVTIEGGATATIENVDMKLALRFVKDPATKTITPYVDDFQIVKIGFIDVRVFGLGPFDFLADLVADFIVNLIKYLIPILCDNVIQNIIQEVLNNIFSKVV